MYWFNNQFSELTRSILFPGGGGASGDNYASFNPRSAPDYHSRLPDEPLSGGNSGGRRRAGPSDYDGGDHYAARSPRSRPEDDSWRRNAERDQYLRDSEDAARQANRPAAPRNPNPRPPEAPRSNLPPILQGPLRLPPIFRPPAGPLPDTPNPTGPLRLPSLPSIPAPFRRPGSGNP